MVGKVSKEYRGARLSDFSDCVDPNTIDWHRHGFCLRGSPGIGKTHLAAALAWECMNPDHRPSVAHMAMVAGEFSHYTYLTNNFVWVSTPMLMCRIRGSFNNKRENEFDIVRDMLLAEVMVLDDLGSEKASDFSSSTLYAIISERRNQQKMTIITTNQTLKDINEWEPRIASRLAEFATIKLPDVDRRVHGANSSGDGVALAAGYPLRPQR